MHDFTCSLSAISLDVRWWPLPLWLFSRSVKVGGMRVVQHKQVKSESEKTEEEKPAEDVAENAENEKNETEEVVEKEYA